MKQFFTLTLIFAAISVYAQPFATGKRSFQFTDAQRSNRSIPADIYYPAATTGNDVNLISGTTKFPVVVFAHGFLIGSSSYKWLADSLVKTGYIVVFPNTEESVLPSHLDFGLDLNFLARSVTALNDSTGSFLYQRVIKKAALGGHSMGGGATFLAAALQNNVVKAIFNFAAAETTPSATTAAALDFKPTLIIGGSGDCVVKDSVQNAMYESILLACKTYVNFTDYWHCQYANNNLICATGQLAAGCGLFPPVNTQVVFTKTISLVSPFLDYYLKDICARGDAFTSTYTNLTGVTTKRRSCFFLPSCGPLPVTLVSFSGIADGNTNVVKWSTLAEENTNYFELERSADGNIFSTLAQINAHAASGIGATYTHIDNYPISGLCFYRLRMVDKDGNNEYSNIIKIETRRKPLSVTQLYPNPVKDLLTIEFQSDKTQEVGIVIFDITGKQMIAQKTKINAGINSMNIGISALSKGSYILQVKDNSGTIAGIFKLIKE